MVERSLNHEILGWLTWRLDLWADPGVRRHKRAVCQRGPITTDGFVETFGAIGVDIVVGSIHPLHVRSEPRLPR